MEFADIIKKRYAVKKFDTNKKVSEEKLQQLLEFIRNAPSSFNIQPWAIKIVSNQETKEKLFKAGWHQSQINTCSHLLVFCANTNIKSHINMLEELMINQGSTKEEISGYINMMRDFESKMTEEHRLSWSQRQLYLALGNALNGAISLGFDSSPMEGFNSGEFAEILSLPKNIVPTALCAIGYAADEPRPKLRLPKKEVFI